jgi:hypothetical protein
MASPAAKSNFSQECGDYMDLAKINSAKILRGDWGINSSEGT